MPEGTQHETNQTIVTLQYSISHIVIFRCRDFKRRIIAHKYDLNVTIKERLF